MQVRFGNNYFMARVSDHTPSINGRSEFVGAL